MFITRKDKVKRPDEQRTGARIYTLIGDPEPQGGTTNHSVSHIVVPPNCSTKPHYHLEAEETYYILKGKARMVIDDKAHFLSPGDAVLIRPPERHQIFAQGEEDMEFLSICVPAWEPSTSIFLDERA